MKQSVEREVVLGRRSCLGVRIGRVWTVGCPNDLEARASSLELRSALARKQNWSAPRSGIQKLLGAWP